MLTQSSEMICKCDLNPRRLLSRLSKLALRRMQLGVVIGGLMVSTFCWSAGEAVTAKTFKELTAIQEMISGDQTREASAALQKLHAEVEKGSTDEALVLQMLGYAEMGQNNYKSAIDYLRRSLALDRLPESAKYNVGYMVAQLYAAEEQYEQALQFASQWFKTLTEPTPDQAIFMANIFAQTGDYKSAIPYTEQAIATAAEPKESWYQMLVASHFELKNYQQAATALETLIKLHPKKSEYWEQLASVYMALNQEMRGLAVLQLAWKTGVLKKESSIRSMVQLAISRGIPDHAARLLQAAMDQELLPRDKIWQDMLANAWLAARESAQAIAAFETLAGITDEGDPWIRIATIHSEKGEWQPAETALAQGLRLKLKEPGKAWLMLGIVKTEQSKFDEGLDAFKKARTFGDAEKQANTWIKYAEDLRRQHNWIARNKAGEEQGQAPF